MQIKHDEPMPRIGMRRLAHVFFLFPTTMDVRGRGSEYFAYTCWLDRMWVKQTFYEEPFKHGWFNDYFVADDMVAYWYKSYQKGFAGWNIRDCDVEKAARIYRKRA